jgi:hypothetical protein
MAIENVLRMAKESGVEGELRVTKHKKPRNNAV